MCMRWRDRLSWISWRLVLGLFAAALVGAGGIIFLTEFNRHTSTTKFCTSCHSMAPIAGDPHYLQSAHINNSSGVSLNCGDCHIPKTNWFVETYVHQKSGIRDAIAEMTVYLDDRKGWDAHRIAMAKEVRDTMRGEGNATCKSCHAPANIKPASQSGQMIHASLPPDDQTACVSCHRNLVHSRPGAMSSADEIAAIKRATEDTVHSRHLANIHIQKGLSCQTCHGDDLIPDANASAVNAQCGTCHGGLEQVAQTHKGPPWLNPHASHLGNIPCSSCHMGHQESKAYCLNCHKNFNMPIPGGAAKATARAEDARQP
jgi:nitrate/TMAO reductase-like tetraheme cytochrome c subunit